MATAANKSDPSNFILIVIMILSSRKIVFITAKASLQRHNAVKISLENCPSVGCNTVIIPFKIMKFNNWYPMICWSDDVCAQHLIFTATIMACSDGESPWLLFQLIMTFTRPTIRIAMCGKDFSTSTVNHSNNIF